MGRLSFCSWLAVTGIGSCLELRQFVWAAFRWSSMSRALGKCSELRYSLLRGIQLAKGHMELPSCPLALIFTCSCKIGCACLWFVVSQFKASRSIKDSGLVWLLFAGSGPFLLKSRYQPYLITDETSSTAMTLQEVICSHHLNDHVALGCS